MQYRVPCTEQVIPPEQMIGSSVFNPAASRATKAEAPVLRQDGKTGEYIWINPPGAMSTPAPPVTQPQSGVATTSMSPSEVSIPSGTLAAKNNNPFNLEF